jgi:hypothetical protein
MPQTQITLPPRLTAAQLRLVLKYFERTERLSPQEWRIVFDTFDALGKGAVSIGKRRMTFQQVYDRHVESAYAENFIAKLLARERPEREAEALEKGTALEILAMLEQAGLYDEEVPGSEYLASYCLYWWTAFARGYRFEVTIFQDLRASGITFVAHDLRKPTERRSPYDLVVQRQLGDVKNTTYFLHAARTRRLSCDFYITRLYAARQRRYLRVVLMTHAAWKTWNGEVPIATLETAADFFPEPIQVMLEGQPFVLAPYDLWKQRVKRRQEEEKP